MAKEKATTTAPEESTTVTAPEEVTAVPLDNAATKSLKIVNEPGQPTQVIMS